jgi:hypothetical protein
VPPYFEAGKGHKVACYLFQEGRQDHGGA